MTAAVVVVEDSATTTAGSTFYKYSKKKRAALCGPFCFFALSQVLQDSKYDLKKICQ